MAVDIIETEIPAKMLQVKLLSAYPRPRDQRSSPSRFSGFILEAVGGYPESTLAERSELYASIT